MSKSPTLNEKQKQFAREYLVDRNGTQAAIRAGYSAKTAPQIATRLLKNVHVAAHIEKATAKVANKMELSVERTLQEVARLAFFDPRKLYREDGSQKPSHELDDDTAAAVAAIDYGPEGGRKVRVWDKNQALDKAMKYLGLFEKDNMQQRDDIKVEVALVSPTRDVLP